MKWIVSLLIATAVAAVTGMVAYMGPASGQADQAAAPIYGIKSPRDTGTGS